MKFNIKKEKKVEVIETVDLDIEKMLKIIDAKLHFASGNEIVIPKELGNDISIVLKDVLEKEKMLEDFDSKLPNNIKDSLHEIAVLMFNKDN